jgi:hypothetical protein
MINPERRARLVVTLGESRFHRLNRTGQAASAGGFACGALWQLASSTGWRLLWGSLGAIALALVLYVILVLWRAGR